ncbi:diacylglycerol kinase [Oryzihumus leptocrescens]|uniref:Diacylglycerol kinase n=1 Tax=Oryzihumus leptocrescens TaxID=297536 RepID=A0A542ZIY9_9MICO|nr:diacylglycerol kinase [Oryzihumus leptocrescens]TQL60314.1 diacylglycerol kinase [Oryzihumus leptocrescens]
MHKRIGLVVNPTSGKGRGARIGAEVAARLIAQGHEVVDCSDETAAAARDRALAAVASGLDVLAVTGGDGIVNLGVNLTAGTDTALGIVAAGTGNDIARGLGLPVHDPAAAAEVIGAGSTRRIDAARVGDDLADPRWFAGVLGAGFDSLVNERANRWDWPRGRMRYNLAIARELPVFKPIPYVIEVDGVRQETEAMLVAVGNGPSYGGGMMVCPDARFDDGELDVLVLHKISIPAFLRVFPTVFSGAHVRHPAVEILRGRRVRLEAQGIMGYADGERFAPLPLTAEAVPGALRVMVPRA